MAPWSNCTKFGHFLQARIARSTLLKFGNFGLSIRYSLLLVTNNEVGDFGNDLRLIPHPLNLETKNSPLCPFPLAFCPALDYIQIQMNHQNLGKKGIKRFKTKKFKKKNLII